jgi:hypothetical protein
MFNMWIVQSRYVYTSSPSTPEVGRSEGGRADDRYVVISMDNFSI